MPSRTFGFRGLRVRVEISDRLASRFRRNAASTSDADRAKFHAPPAIKLRSRDSQRAIDFLRNPALAGDGSKPSPELLRYLREQEARRDAAITLSDRVASVSWYHTIELPGGVVTPGAHDHRWLVPHFELPDDMSGKRVLDIATFDGFWAFDFERRGAEVTALDVPSVRHYDWPGSAARIVEGEGLDLPVGGGFSIAHEALDSEVKRLEGSIYDLDPCEHGTYDVVHLGDLLVHLSNPLAALRGVRRVTKRDGLFVLAEVFDPDLASPDRMLYQYLGGYEGLAWGRPSLQLLAQWVVDAGFSRVEVRKTYDLPSRYGAAAQWRALIHARP